MSSHSCEHSASARMRACVDMRVRAAWREKQKMMPGSYDFDRIKSTTRCRSDLFRAPPLDPRRGLVSCVRAAARTQSWVLYGTHTVQACCRLCHMCASRIRVRLRRVALGWRVLAALYVVRRVAASAARSTACGPILAIAVTNSLSWKRPFSSTTCAPRHHRRAASARGPDARAPRSGAAGACARRCMRRPSHMGGRRAMHAARRRRGAVARGAWRG